MIKRSSSTTATFLPTVIVDAHTPSKGELARAIQDYDKAIELDSEYPFAYNNRGFVYYREGDNARAIQDYNQAITLKPNYVTAYYNRGLAYKSAGEREKAIADFERCLALDNDPKFQGKVKKRIEELGGSS